MKYTLCIFTEFCVKYTQLHTLLYVTFIDINHDNTQQQSLILNGMHCYNLQKMHIEVIRIKVVVHAVIPPSN